MAVRVAFVSPKGVNAVNVQLLTGARVVEKLTIPASTTASATTDREIAFVLNEEASTVMVATGSVPDAATATQTAASTAGVPLAAGQSAAFALNSGDKVNVKAAT